MSDLGNLFVGVMGVKDGATAIVQVYSEEEDPFTCYQRALNVAKTLGINVTQSVGYIPAKSDLRYGEYMGADGKVLVKKQVGVLVRRTYTGPNREGEVIDTPVIDLYPPMSLTKNGKIFGQYRFTTVYFNNPDDIAAFEEAVGLRYEDLNEYHGDGAPQRKWNSQKAIPIIKDYEYIFDKPIEVECEVIEYDKRDDNGNVMMENGEAVKGTRYILRRWQVD